MTCKNRFIFMAAICLGLMVTSTRGGSLDAPAAPTNPASAMWTLEDIYQVLDTRATNVTKRTGAFAEPTGGPTNGTMHTLNEIMTLVTNRSPVAKSGQTNISMAGDDGTTRIGMAWPNPRFKTNNIAAAGTNVVTDIMTGLMWTRNPNLPTVAMLKWTNAVEYCATNMNIGPGTYGYTDWRLPNVTEMLSLIAWQYYDPAISDWTGTNKWTTALGPFTSKPPGEYWSSTLFSIYSDRAWIVRFSDGYAAYRDKQNPSQGACYVWPVRGGGQ